MQILSWGFFFFIFIPCLGAMGFLIMGYWGLAMFPILFIFYFLRITNENKKDSLGEFQSDYLMEFAYRNSLVFNAFLRIGNPERENGTFSDRQKILWGQALEIEKDFNDWNKTMHKKLVNMEMGIE